MARAASYDVDLERMVEEGLAEVGGSLAGRSVLLKPNLVEYDPGTVVNTDPRLVAATVLAVRRLGASAVLVAEGPGHRRDTPFVVSGLRSGRTTRRGRARFVDLNLAPVTRVPLHARFTDLGELVLPALVVEADVVISMPKMKTHHWAGATLSMKNCFGVRARSHLRLAEERAALGGLQEAIVDAAGRANCRSSTGSSVWRATARSTGRPSGWRAVFGPVATDSTAALLMGLDPAGIWHVSEAGRFLGQADPEQIVQVGEDPQLDDLVRRAAGLRGHHARLERERRRPCWPRRRERLTLRAIPGEDGPRGPDPSPRRPAVARPADGGLLLRRPNAAADGPWREQLGMVAVAASVDLYTGDPQRVDLLAMPDNSFVSLRDRGRLVLPSVTRRRRASSPARRPPRSSSRPTGRR